VVDGSTRLVNINDFVCQRRIVRKQSVKTHQTIRYIIYIKKKEDRPSTGPCGTPALTGRLQSSKTKKSTDKVSLISKKI
jgi:hypothetical protein